MKAPCRVCDEFKHWAKDSKTSEAKEAREDASTRVEPKEISKESSTPVQLPCPPDSLELGSSTWTFLHTMASYYPDKPDISTKTAATQLINSLSTLYPCSYCAKHLKKELVDHPPKVETRTELERYLCDLHNEVNERLGKPLFDCSRVRERWRDGPSDGRCQ